MNVASTRQELILAADSQSRMRGPASMLDSVHRALRSAAPDGSLERVTLLAAEADAVLWLRADYSSNMPALAEPVSDAAPAVAAVMPVPRVRPSPQRTPRPSHDPTRPYVQALDSADALPKGTLLDVLA
jgi:hypothetical protein